jgi:hypothetical protein
MSKRSVQEDDVDSDVEYDNDVIPPSLLGKRTKRDNSDNARSPMVGVSRSPSPSRSKVSKLELEPVSKKTKITWNPPPTDRPVRVYGKLSRKNNF